MKRIVVLLMAIIIVVSGCTESMQSATPKLSPTQTLIPTIPYVPSLTHTLTPALTPFIATTFTSTPQPPLTDHEWHPESILISMRETYGDGGTFIGDLGTTWFILYADGTLIVNKLIVGNDTYQYQYLTQKLNQQEICQHLNTLDQLGFLDYNASDYTFIGGKPYGQGGGSSLFQVNAWKSKDDSYYDLEFYLRQDIINDLYGQKGYPIISPALRNTYYFLSQYPMTRLEVYKPERLAVWIVPADYVRTDYEETAQTWQLSAPTLRSLLQQSSNYIDGSEEKYIELKGSDAKAVYSYLGSTTAISIFEQGISDGTKQYYAVKVRPLLPYENLNGDNMSDISPPIMEKTNFNLSCSASDDVLPIPTPTEP